MKSRIPAILIILPLVCIGFLLSAQAVVPPPDGGYPGFNTAEGTNALKNLTAGAANTAIGWFSLFTNTEGSFNTATGAGALLFNTANENTAFGAAALLFNTTGLQNTAVGAAALLSNNTASFNTAIGENALSNNTTGGENTATGRAALFNNTTGDHNIALGVSAGQNLTTGNNNIDIGNVGVAGESDTIRIGASQDRTFIAGIRGAEPVNGVPLQVLIDLDGQLGTIVSSRRFKNEIKPMDQTSEAIHSLKPVTFHYKSDTTDTPQFGLIAEEVAAVNPDLVVRDEKGEMYTVRYDAVNAMLLNEFLKEHRKVQQLEKEVERLTAGLQRVSDQIELSKAAPRIAADKP